MKLSTGMVPIRVCAAQVEVRYEFAMIAKKCRKHKRLSIDAVAQQSGVPANRLEQFEKRAEVPSFPEIVRLSAVYGVEAAVITRRLKRVYDQLAAAHLLALENLLHLKWSRARPEVNGAVSREGARVTSKHHDVAPRPKREVWLDYWPQLLPPTLRESLLAECIQLVIATTALDACVVAHVRTGLVQRGGACPQAADASEMTRAVTQIGRDELLSRVPSHLDGVMDRLELLASCLFLRGPMTVLPIAAGSGEGRFYAQQIDAQRGRIAEARKLIPLFKSERACLKQDGSSEIHTRTDRAESLSGRRENDHQALMSPLNHAIDQLSEAAYNLFQLSRHRA